MKTPFKAVQSRRVAARVLNRRTLLRGAGSVVIGLPFLEAMLRPGTTHAQNQLPKRFIVFYHPGGTLLDQWRPVGTPGNYSFSEMMAPLTPFKDKLTFVDGVNLSITSIGAGHPHSRGMAGVLTGRELASGDINTNGGNAGFGTGPSLDQVLAPTLSDGLRFNSLEFSAGWSTGISSGGQPHPGNTITYQGDQQAIPPATSPLAAFNRIFKDLDSSADGGTSLEWNKSIIDAVKGEYETLSLGLGAADKAKLDEHLTVLRQAEAGLLADVADSCVPPQVNMMEGFYEDTGPLEGGPGQSRGDVDGGANGVLNGTGVPRKGAIMTDLLAASIACDVTRVATMQWSDSEAKFQLSFLKDRSGETLVDHHHGYQHDRGFQPEALFTIYNWYASNFATLLEKLSAIQEGDSTALDNSLVLWVTELQLPETHGQDNMPFVIAGGKNISPTFATGRWLQVDGKSHNDMLSSIQGYFGEPNPRFGHQEFVTGPLAGL
jgi:hypothetical protein